MVNMVARTLSIILCVMIHGIPTVAARQSLYSSRYVLTTCRIRTVRGGGRSRQGVVSHVLGTGIRRPETGRARDKHGCYTRAMYHLLPSSLIIGKRKREDIILHLKIAPKLFEASYPGRRAG
jgi:hypothetical protein